VKPIDFVFWFAIIVALIAAAYLACTFGIDKSNAAEWAGAIGAVAAVFSALYTASHAIRFEADRNKAHARVCAHFLAPPIISINNSALAAQSYAEERNFGLDDLAEEEFLTKVLARIGIQGEVPEEALRDAWSLPDEVARDCIRLQAFLDQYKALVKNYVPRFRLMTAAEKDEYIRAMAISLPNVIGLSTRARTGLGKVLGEKTGA
jgi:hypothetical protein